MVAQPDITSNAPSWPDIRRDMLRWFARVFAINTFIAIALWAGGLGSFDQQMVYSQAIGLSIWLLINGTAVVWSLRTGKHGLPTGIPLFLLMAFAIAGGFYLGTQVGNAYAGVDALLLANSNPRTIAAMFLMTLAVGVATTYHFYAESRSAEMARALAQSERQTSDARLALLQSQLEPHMLFNTLANLRALIATEPTQAIAMLDRLNDYLRATLSASRRPMHPLVNEFERLLDYLELMRVRMANRLQVNFELPTDLQAWPVPTLLLQPIVENSIKHGLTPAPEGGTITIRARRDGDTLLLEVLDTGVGASATDSAPVTSAGFGLAQVRERLATTYGDAATLVISANAPQGTVVRITIPRTP